MQLGQYIMIGGIYIAVFILLHLVETLNKRVYELEKKVIDLRCWARK
jgi:hypothetical protein